MVSYRGDWLRMPTLHLCGGISRACTAWGFYDV